MTHGAEGGSSHSLPSAPLVAVGSILQQNIVCAALYTGGGGNQRQLGLFTQLRDGQCAAVAHGGTHLCQRGGHAVGQCAGIGNLSMYTALHLSTLRIDNHFVAILANNKRLSAFFLHKSFPVRISS